MQPSDRTGRVGKAWASEWRRTDRSFAGLDTALVAAIVAAMAGRAGRLIDLGCGAGATSLAVAAALPAARIVGIDLSADLVAVARARAVAAGLGDRCTFVVGDATRPIAGELPVDGLFSRHGVMFFPDPVAAFAGLRAGVGVDTPLVFSCFAEPAANLWATETVAASSVPGSAPGPVAFADPDRVLAILAKASWRAGAPQRVAYRYLAGAGPDAVADAVAFFHRIGPAAGALAAADDADRPALRDHLRSACAARAGGGEVAFPAAAWIWTARAG